MTQLFSTLSSLSLAQDRNSGNQNTWRIDCMFSSVQWLSRVCLFGSPWPAGRWASVSITNSRGLLKLMSIESVMPPLAGRSAYLDEACGSDAALRQRVEALLASHEQAGSFLGTPVPQRLAEKRATPEEVTQGEPPRGDGEG